MSVRIMAAVFESSTLKAGERLVMLALADHADDQGRCYPSTPRLAQRTGMSERAVQGHIKALRAEGYLQIEDNAGPGGTNLFFVRPTPATPADSAPPQKLRPRKSCATPPQKTSFTPAESADEPSRTTIEPSVSIPAEEKPADILGQVASPEAARSFIAFRSKIKKPLTDTAARRVAASLTLIANQGGDADDALGMAEERGWQSVKPEWYFKETRNGQSSGQDRRTSARTDALRHQIHVAAGMQRTPREDCF